MTDLKPFEYDNLESSLLRQKSGKDIYGVTAEWLLQKFNAYFVIFIIKDPSYGVKNIYSLCKKTPEKTEDDYLKERIKNCTDAGCIYLHESGIISVPFSQTAFQSGYILIGAQADGKTPYDDGCCKILVPVARILNKALMKLDARNIYIEAARIENAFSHYVSPDIVQDIRKNPDKIHLGGEKKFLTCVFTDLQNFTQLTESLEPSMLVKILNMYLNEMSQVILALGGTIDKFVGDAMMAFFGAPHELKDHAVRCCLASIRMKRMEDVLNAQLLREKLITRPLFTRIGINSGDMIVGNVGSMQRLAYTVIGQNVNIASRIENANKKYGTGILISGATFEIVRDFFECRFIGPAELRGVTKPVNLYELIKDKEGMLPEYDNYEKPDIDSSLDDDIADVEEVTDL